MDENENKLKGFLFMRVIAVVGIRSQYIKLYAIQKMLKQSKEFDNLDLICVDAGQHYDYELAGGFINELGITFEYKIHYNNKDPMHIFSEMLYELYKLLCECNSKEKIDYVMCFGDANTTMATAIAASKAGLKLVHVEAGLRLGNPHSPEEGNRIVADHLSRKLFVSNKADLFNIEREGLMQKSYFSGDVIQDLVMQLDKDGELNIEPKYYNQKFYEYNRDDFVIASMHRKENINDNCVVHLFESFKSVKHNILFLAHPSVIDLIDSFSYDKDKITVAHYIPYIDMLSCVKRCRYLITDSGAFQREAYYLKKNCLIRQDKAFWGHLVDIGAHLLTGKSTNEICEGIEQMEDKLKDDEYPYTDYFGEGQAVNCIFRVLMEDH